MSLTGTTQAAPNYGVDPAPPGGFTVLTGDGVVHLWKHALGVNSGAGVPAPSIGDALVAVSGVLGVSSQGIYRVSGSVADALVGLTIGQPYRIRGSVKTPPTGVNLAYVVWCADASLSSGYILRVTATAWAIQKITAGVPASLDTWSTAPVAGDLFEITMSAAGVMAVSINGTNRLNATDTAYLTYRQFGFAIVGDPVIGLYSDGYFTVDNV